MRPRETLHGTAPGYVPAPEPPPREEFADLAAALIASRQNVSPKRLAAPGPSRLQLRRLLEAAAAAPDHGQIVPWRFVEVSQAKRALLAEAFALALIDRDPGATLVQIEAAREKAHRAPLLLLAVVRLAEQADPIIPDAERLVSLGCAMQNMLLAAEAMGYGSGLASGQSMSSVRLRNLFGLGAAEQAVCFVNLGTIVSRKGPRLRPTPDQLLTTL
jgi:nitroreductase